MSLWPFRIRREYPFNEGSLISNKGLDIDVAEYEDHFMELHVKHSNALHSVIKAGERRTSSGRWRDSI